MLIIDAVTPVRRSGRRTCCCPSTPQQISAGIRRSRDVEGAARVVTLDEIAANDCNLNITRYVERKTTEEILTVEEALANLRASLAAAYAAEDRLKSLLVA